MMILDSDDSDSSAGKIVHKSTSHSDDSPKRRAAAAAFSFSDCKNSGKSFHSHSHPCSGEKTFDFINRPSSSLDSRPLGRLIQFTTVHKLQDVSDHCT